MVRTSSGVRSLPPKRDLNAESPSWYASTWELTHMSPPSLDYVQEKLYKSSVQVQFNMWDAQKHWENYIPVTIEVLRHSIVYLSDSENHALSGIQEFAKQTARQRHCIALKERLLQLLVLLSELLPVVLFQQPHVSGFFLSMRKTQE
jgi:hypothetical protein